MIPKVIHYCWFGGNPLPKLAIKCIKSWKKFFPDYEIKEWNETNFNVNIIPYTEEAYKEKKYAFVSDYARFWIIYKYGGIYFDTDVEVIKPMDDIISGGGYFGRESEECLRVNPGLGMAAPSGHPLYREILNVYSTLHFTSKTNFKKRIKSVVDYTSELLEKKGVNNCNTIQITDSIRIYPKEYFAPSNIYNITKKTYSIHYYSSSWKSKSIQRKTLIKNYIPDFVWNFYVKLFKDQSEFNN